jgi:putative (di)nucleoside polyphosphate hydrolase
MSRLPGKVDPLLLPYRPCVGIMLINADGLIWIGRRPPEISAGGENWQMPQGGIDEGEAPELAALRELAEETGTGKAEIIGETRDWLHYDLPPSMLGVALHGKYRGQKQKWFAMRFTGVDTDFNIDNPPGGFKPEFEAWRWARSGELPGLIVPFKRNVYEAVIAEFAGLLR